MWSERWFPDAFVFALVAVVITFGAGLALGSKPSAMVKYFGEGFWSLIPFTMQMVMIIVGGYVVATAAPVYKVIRWLAAVPKTPPGAVAFVAFISTLTSMLSYGFSLIFAGFLAREIAKKLDKVDYRALGAAAYLGLGSIWALGLSSSAALLMATKGSIPPSLLKVSGVIPLSHTIYTWQNLATSLALMGVSVLIAYLSAPTGSAIRTASSMGISLLSPHEEAGTVTSPGEWLEHKPILTVLVCSVGLVFLWQVVSVKGPQAALDLNTYNFLFIVLGLLLHWRPKSFTRAVSASVPATAGVLIQFPFYAAIFGMITYSPIAQTLADIFVKISNKETYPLLVSIYSAVLGLFVPSGGGKWLIEAPYVMAAANDLHVNLGWTVQIYNAAEALPNLINPFWMLPLLGILKLRARDLAGYGFLQLLVHVPVVLSLMWFFSRTFPYFPPAVP